MALRHACLKLDEPGYAGEHTGRQDNWRVGGWFRQFVAEQRWSRKTLHQWRIRTGGG
jgi:hypothetical protein